MISIKYLAKHVIIMKNSHHTNHKEWTKQDELNKFLLLICSNKPREEVIFLQMFEINVRWKLDMVIRYF